MSNRAWFKVWAEQWLRGEISKLPIDTRGAWVTLLAAVTDGAYADIGELKVAEKVGLTDTQIALLLCISPEEWLEYKRTLVLADMISVSPENILRIVNWQKYQSEYMRQKPYRELLASCKEDAVSSATTGAPSKENGITSQKKFVLSAMYKIFLDLWRERHGVKYNSVGYEAALMWQLYKKSNEKFDKFAPMWEHSCRRGFLRGLRTIRGIIKYWNELQEPVNPMTEA